MSYAEPTTHDLKCWPEYFEAVADGRKSFELREDDRGYLEGDTLLLREYNPNTNTYTGREIRRLVTYILRSTHFNPIGFGLRRQYVVMGLAPVWVSVEEQLPEVQGYGISAAVLAVENTGAQVIVSYDHRWKRWIGLDYEPHITYWQHLGPLPGTNPVQENREL
ncbi:ASCH/PUA domain-containing protein [Hymenobacter metallilatus]|uniref:DUF3850 domain-containing protein n=1 Tax=Hymenobacter metallilatus TaxID=2493666 RepID=A0A428JCQ5_9BACT|nr:ASCH/PUA domain-containing protein [Hymenobacter metallilatus]RSK29864.1 DUF3850 domain-containing protein [Hymenobacter metallilatus]